MPEISPSLQAFIRVAYGVLMLLTLVWAWPHRRRFFLSERWNGYAESRPSVDWAHNPWVSPIMLAAWAACCLALVAGVLVVPAAILNLLLCRYYFVQMRWKGLLRGMGAPGFMAYWLGAVVCLLEITARHLPSLHGLALLVAQVDFAFIMLSAGVYKWTAGYAAGEGMDYGMANPEWGYWWRAFKNLRPGHPLYRFLNHAAWSTEVMGAVLMLLPDPGLRALGGLLTTGSFLFIATQIRLGWLAEMVMVCGLLLVYPGHPLDAAIARAIVVIPPAPTLAPAWVATLLAVCLWGYLILLPVAHAGLFYNFYRRARLPGVLQSAFERYTNVIGLIIWRVFSVDHLNFFVRIYRQDRQDGTRALLSVYGSSRAWRFAHVAESIVITTIFTTLKYYASQRPLFETRLRRYARTLPIAPGSLLVFEYVVIRKQDERFAHVPTLEFIVDPATEEVVERVLEPGFNPGAAAPASPVHEAARPGSYAPVIR